MDIYWILVCCGIMSCVVGLAIGANDVANSFSTSVGSGALSMQAAIGTAFVFEILGATLLGASVTNSIRTKIMNLSVFKDEPELLAIGMLSSSIAISMWLIIATYAGLPVSTTHSIIGGLIGFGIASGRGSSVNWGTLSLVVLSWLLVPLGTIIISSLTYLAMSWIIKEFSAHFYKFICIFCALSCLPVSVFLALKHPFVEDNVKEASAFIRFINEYKLATFCIIYAIFIAITTTLSMLLTKYRMKTGYKLRSNDNFHENKSAADAGNSQDLEQDNPELPQHEIVLSSMQVIAAVMNIISHASNDTANAAMPIATVLSLYMHGFEAKPKVPWYILLGAGVSMSIGLALFGGRVMKIVGFSLTEVIPSRGYTIDSTVSTVVMILSYLGVPLSSTHCTVSAIFGVGMVLPERVEADQERVEASPESVDAEPDVPRGFFYFCNMHKCLSLKRVNLRLYKKIFVAWLVTIFFSGACSAIAFLLIKVSVKAFS